MIEAASRNQILLARLVVVLIIVFLVAGLTWSGFSADVRQRIWQNLLDRPSGPMMFRFILQPVMAAIAALRDGIRMRDPGAPSISGRCSPIPQSSADVCAKV